MSETIKTITTAYLVEQIEAFAKRTGKSEKTVCREALNDGAFITKIREGGGYTIDSAEKLMKYITEYRHPAPAAGEGPGEDAA